VSGGHKRASLSCQFMQHLTKRFCCIDVHESLIGYWFVKLITPIAFIYRPSKWCLVILSTCRFVNLPFCQLAILSTCHFVNLPFCQLAVLSTCRFVNLPFCQLAVLSTCRFVNLPFCQLAVLSSQKYEGEVI
jgi:hypothetical protein